MLLKPQRPEAGSPAAGVRRTQGRYKLALLLLSARGIEKAVGLPQCLDTRTAGVHDNPFRKAGTRERRRII